MIYIECGAHSGARIRTFLKERGKDVEKVYGFECHPDLQAKLAQLPKPLVEIIPKAAWIENTQLPFYRGVNLDQASSVFQHKKEGRLTEESVMVEAVDFDAWMTATIEKGKHVFLRMNMEGSEYPVLQKMLKTGSIDLVTELEVELHRGSLKIPDVTAGEELYLIGVLKTKFGDRFTYGRDAGAVQLL
jgi:FkbM family methyltransferase